jgi:hypothetical protein
MKGKATSTMRIISPIGIRKKYFKILIIIFLAFYEIPDERFSFNQIDKSMK